MKFVIISFLCLIVLLGCGTDLEQTACSQLEATEFKSLEFGRMEARDVIQWLRNSSFSQADIGRERQQHDIIRSTLSWKQAGKMYNADFRNGVLVRVDVQWEKDTSLLVGSDILTCLGEPTAYQAFYNPGAEYTILNLSLWYPDKGIMVLAFQPSDMNEVINENIEIDLIGFASPQPPELMVEDMYPYGYFEEVREEMVGRLKPWPGDWEDIVIDEQ